MRRDDDEVRHADRIGDHEACSPFEVHDDKLRLCGGGLDLIDDRIFADIADDGDGIRLSGERAPLRYPFLGVGVDDHDLGPSCGKLGCQKKRGGGLAGSPLGIGEGDNGHGKPLLFCAFARINEEK